MTDRQIDQLSEREIGQVHQLETHMALVVLRAGYEQMGYDQKLLAHYIEGAPHPDDDKLPIDMMEEWDAITT